MWRRYVGGFKLADVVAALPAGSVQISRDVSSHKLLLSYRLALPGAAGGSAGAPLSAAGATASMAGVALPASSITITGGPGAPYVAPGVVLPALLLQQRGLAAVGGSGSGSGGSGGSGGGGGGSSGGGSGGGGGGIGGSSGSSGGGSGGPSPTAAGGDVTPTAVEAALDAYVRAQSLGGRWTSAHRASQHLRGQLGVALVAEHLDRVCAALPGVRTAIVKGRRMYQLPPPGGGGGGGGRGGINPFSVTAERLGVLEGAGEPPLAAHVVQGARAAPAACA
jgi:hypothetical protein